MERSLFIRHLRQLAELGGPEAYLDGMSPSAAIQAAARLSSAGASARTSASASDLHTSVRDNTALTILGQQASGCTLCRLHQSRSTVVFGEGNPNADVVVVGEAPGFDEDRTGRPFVGRAGKLLDLMLLSIGFPRHEVYICNVLKCRPPENRNPLPDEVEHCTSTFLFPQLDAIAPRVLLAVGKFAAQSLLNSEEAIGKLRGRVHIYRGTPLIVSYHPAFLLRSSNMVRVAWQDLQLVRRVLDEQS